MRGVDSGEIAEGLLVRAVAMEQAVMRCDDRTPVAEIRERVRRLAHERDIPIRTGMVDDVLVVVRADAAIWQDSTAIMRSKLSAPAAAGVIS